MFIALFCLLLFLVLKFSLSRNFGFGLITLIVFLFTYILPAVLEIYVLGHYEIFRRSFSTMHEYRLFDTDAQILVLFFVATYSGIYFLTFTTIERKINPKYPLRLMPTHILKIASNLVWLPIVANIVGMVISWSIPGGIYYSGGWLNSFFWLGVFLPTLSLPVYVLYFGVDRRAVILLCSIILFWLFEQRLTNTTILFYFVVSLAFYYKLLSLKQIITVLLAIFFGLITVKYLFITNSSGSGHWGLIDILYFDIGRIWVLSTLFDGSYYHTTRNFFTQLIPFYCEAFASCVDYQYAVEKMLDSNFTKPENPGGIGASGLGELWLIFGLAGSVTYSGIMALFHGYLDAQMRLAEPENKIKIMAMFSLPFFFLNAHSGPYVSGIAALFMVSIFVIFCNLMSSKLGETK